MPAQYCLPSTTCPAQPAQHNLPSTACPQLAQHNLPSTACPQLAQHCLPSTVHPGLLPASACPQSTTALLPAACPALHCCPHPTVPSTTACKCLPRRPVLPTVCPLVPAQYSPQSTTVSLVLYSHRTAHYSLPSIACPVQSAQHCLPNATTACPVLPTVSTAYHRCPVLPIALLSTTKPTQAGWEGVSPNCAGNLKSAFKTGHF